MSPYRRRVYQDDARRELQEVVDRLASQQPLRRVLDAGCGFSLPLDFPPTVELVGLDASAEALAKNENVDEAVVGDIETHEFDASFDAVLFWTVLEHLERPELALRKFSRTLRRASS